MSKERKRKVLGVIPARGGSKGVLDKNIRLLNGKPLIFYTIEAARKSELLTDFVVSTESKKIAHLCESIGLEFPFMRPVELAQDDVESYPVILHGLQEMEKTMNTKYDYIMMLQPTTPLRTYNDIDNSLNILFKSEVESVVSVVDVGGNHPLRMKRIVGENILINYIDQGFENMRPRQKLPPVYIRNGAIYASKRNVLIEKSNIITENCLAYLMSSEKSINIDNNIDLKLAELLIKEKNNILD